MPAVWWQIADYLRHGGFVMGPLVAVSVVMWALIIDRLREFARWRRGDLDIRAAAAFVEAEAGPTPVLPSTGLRAGLVREFLAARSGEADLDRDLLALCTARLDRRLTASLAAIAVLAAVAPLLGLLGTVLGMIETFDVISVFGTGNSRALAGGIGVALITTQTGLLVAIPGLLMSNRLQRIAQRLRARLGETSAALDRRLARKETAR